MRFRADLKPFADAAAAAARVVAGRTTIPILSHVKLDAAGHSIRLTASDLDREIEIAFAARVETPGETTVSASALNDALRIAPKGAEVAFELGERGVTLRTGKPRYVLPVLPATDFPAMSNFGQFAAPVALDGKTFAAELAAVMHAVSTEETHYYLNGVYFHGTDDGLRLVATDGHRLMRVDLPVKAGAAAAIVPSATVKAFLKIAEGATEVTLELSDRMARLTAGSTRLVSKLIDGTFPDYGRVTPTDFTNVAIVDSQRLRDAVQRALIACAEGRGIALDFADQRLKIEGRSAEGGEASDEVEFEREACVRIGFNARYLAEAVAALGGVKARFNMGDPSGPAKITDAARNDRLIVLMPVRI